MRAILCILICVIYAPAGAALEVVFSAREISRAPATDVRPERVVLLGEVRIEGGGVRIEAVGVVYAPPTGELYAEGPVVLIDAERGVRLFASRLSYDIRRHVGLAEDARIEFGAGTDIGFGEVETLIVSAERIERRGRDRFRADDVYITTCDFAVPHYRLTARAVEVEPGVELVASRVRLRLGNVPIFAMPRYTRSLLPGARSLGGDIRLGSSGRWGWHFNIAPEFPVMRDPEAAVAVDMWGLRLGYRERRGWDGGAAIAWDGLEAQGVARMDVFSESATSATDDLARATRNAAARASPVVDSAWPMSASRYLSDLRGEPEPDDATLLTYAGETRYFARVEHSGEIAGNWRTDARIFFASDRDVRLEYLERDARRGLPDFSYIDFFRRTETSRLGLHTGFRTGDFRTETEYLPEVRFSSPVTDLGAFGFASFEAGAGYLRRSYDALLAEDDLAAFRARGRLVIRRPFRLGAVAFTPYLGGEAAWYDRSRIDEDSFGQAAALYGGSISTRAFALLRGGTRPLRHAIRAAVEYAGMGDPSRDASEAIGFDRHDDLLGADVLRFTLDQRLQTKSRDASGVERGWDLAGLVIEAEMFAESRFADLLNGGERWKPVNVAAFYRPVPAVSVYAELEVAPPAGAVVGALGGFELSGATGPELDPETVSWRAGAALLRESIPGEETSNEMLLSLGLDPRGRWSVQFTARYQLEDVAGADGLRDYRLTLTRDFHDLRLALGFWRDPARDDSGVSISVRPTARPVNLPVR